MLAVWLYCGALVAQNAAEGPAKLTVDGDVAKPLELTVADLKKMTRETATLTEMDGKKTSYDGVPLTEILSKAGVPSGKEMRGKFLAGYVLVEARDGYEVVFSLGELDSGTGTTHATVADERDGQALAEKQGPIRLVVSSDKRPARSVRMVGKLHVVLLKK